MNSKVFKIPHCQNIKNVALLNLVEMSVVECGGLLECGEFDCLLVDYPEGLCIQTEKFTVV